jgi:hypothetical protein
MDGNYQKYDENGQEDNRKLSLWKLPLRKI